MKRAFRSVLRTSLVLGTAMGLAACDDNFQFRDFTSPLVQEPVRVETAPRPEPDSRGVISYPSYQVVAARSGDTVARVAERVGLEPQELARFNGLSQDTSLRGGEILALPRRVAVIGAPSAAGRPDIAAIAGQAIDRAPADRPAATATTGTTAALPGGQEPIRHRVERGETAYSIARLYGVSVRALADWNSLGSDMSVREGQFLLIPVVLRSADASGDVVRPGQGTPTPMPPSAARPLPGAVEAATLPPSPSLGGTPQGESGRSFLRPVSGEITRSFSARAGGGGYEGIDIAAEAGTAVRAAEDGEVALVSRATDNRVVVLVSHSGNLFTVYSNIVDVSLERGARISRGQPIARVAPGSPSFLHFQVRRGTTAIDPAPFLQ
ncbi:MAG: LysM peptidoglycan-binding domain-containing protein [Rhodobacteraceae bacterium]|nr:LysM peptidoglycan-binding domain-containing protein [Paracoccaceae bacterium]